MYLYTELYTHVSNPRIVHIFKSYLSIYVKFWGV